MKKEELIEKIQKRFPEWGTEEQKEKVFGRFGDNDLPEDVVQLFEEMLSSPASPELFICLKGSRLI